MKPVSHPKLVGRRHPALHRPAAPVTEYNTASLRRLARDLIAAHKATASLGIAAPQLGYSIAAFAFTDENGEPIFVVNPTLKTHGDTFESTEGCLSIPGYGFVVHRKERCTLMAFTIEGDPVAYSAEDDMARMFQHEVDHLHGWTIDDRALPAEEPDPSTD